MDAYFDQSRLTIYTKHKTPCAWGIEPPIAQRLWNELPTNYTRLCSSVFKLSLKKHSFPTY